MVIAECQELMEPQSHRCALRSGFASQVYMRFLEDYDRSSRLLLRIIHTTKKTTTEATTILTHRHLSITASAQQQLCNNVVFTLLHLNHSLQQHISILIIVHVYSHGNSKGAQALAVQEQFRFKSVTSK
jgi:hypothetical protein